VDNVWISRRVIHNPVLVPPCQQGFSTSYQQVIHQETDYRTLCGLRCLERWRVLWRCVACGVPIPGLRCLERWRVLWRCVACGVPIPGLRCLERWRVLWRCVARAVARRESGQCGAVALCGACCGELWRVLWRRVALGVRPGTDEAAAGMRGHGGKEDGGV